MHFWKFHGNGNDFVMIDNRHGHYEPQAEEIARLCDRHFGIGADGLIMLGKNDTYDFRMTYFNSDGHEGSMCGNGGRCIVAFADLIRETQKKEVTFRAWDGIHRAYIVAHSKNQWEIRLQMNDVPEATEEFIDTGSPHHIEFVDGLSQLDVLSRGAAIRYSNSYAEIGGVNVNFLQTGNGTIHMRTYERGVEAETLSCGTGSTAAALAYALRYNAETGPVEVKTAGGMLVVDFRKKGQKFTDIWIEGPAEFVFEGDI
jgi:diaminopimelate epimerase